MHLHMYIVSRHVLCSTDAMHRASQLYKITLIPICNITFNPNAQAFSPVSPMLDSPICEFVNNYNLRCMVDLLADEIVSTEIDQDESNSEGKDIPGEILPCDDHTRCATLVTAVSIKL